MTLQFLGLFFLLLVELIGLWWAMLWVMWLNEKHALGVEPGNWSVFAPAVVASMDARGLRGTDYRRLRLLRWCVPVLTLAMLVTFFLACHVAYSAGWIHDSRNGGWQSGR